jgi:type VI secretion system secreted protein VgrG
LGDGLVTNLHVKSAPKRNFRSYDKHFSLRPFFDKSQWRPILSDDELQQSDRIGILSTPIDKQTPRGVDALALVRFDGSEGLSELFEYRIEALSHIENIDFNMALGQQCSVKINAFHREFREFHGILVEAQWLGKKGKHFCYRLVLRPWLWLLSRTTDCRIFLDKTAPEIIKEVFTDNEFGQGSHWESRLEDEGSFPRYEYCVQFRETDLNFVSRLMEKEGIYYYFSHKEGLHKLALANAKSSHDPLLTMQKDESGGVSPRKELPLFPTTGFGQECQHIAHWTSERQFRSGAIELNDYNYEKPTVQMLCSKHGSKDYERGDMQIYEYPGNYSNTKQGQRYADIAFEVEKARDNRRKAGGRAVSLFPGGLTTLRKVSDYKTSGPPDSEYQEYLVVHCEHSYGDQTYRSVGQGAVEGDYRGLYELLPRDQMFRAPIVTPVPRIYGIQTAKVVTKDEGSGEKIDVENLTEIYVQFYWDRRRHKEKRSCKLRCAQMWAAGQWGGQFIPWVGMEVVVQFLEGDPDRPIVTGTVYNGVNKPPCALPSDKTQSAIRDHSGNSIIMEAKSGSEDIRINATKDTNVVVTHDYNETVQTGNRTITIASGTHTEQIKGDTKITVTNGALAVTVAANTATYMSKNATTILSTSADVAVLAKTQISLDVGSSHMLMKADGSIELSGKTITIHGTDGVNIFGDKTITASGDSIGISGGSEAKIGVGGQNTTYDKQKLANSGAAISSSAVGQHEITGALVKIN